eukprot:GILK01007055.1.p1 GENE.GILK01007055.1~~GILK01007055.1.p1  ORF type:complete len:306 (+),score=47.49 GILK01007055.1:51-920(+)
MEVQVPDKDDVMLSVLESFAEFKYTVQWTLDMSFQFGKYLFHSAVDLAKQLQPKTHAPKKSRSRYQNLNQHPSSQTEALRDVNSNVSTSTTRQAETPSEPETETENSTGSTTTMTKLQVLEAELKRLQALMAATASNSPSMTASTASSLASSEQDESFKTPDRRVRFSPTPPPPPPPVPPVPVAVSTPTPTTTTATTVAANCAKKAASAPPTPSQGSVSAALLSQIRNGSASLRKVSQSASSDAVTTHKQSTSLSRQPSSDQHLLSELSKRLHAFAHSPHKDSDSDFNA